MRFDNIFNNAEDIDNDNILNSIKFKGTQSKFGESQFENVYTFEFGNPLLSPKSVTKKKGVLPKLENRNRYFLFFEIRLSVCVHILYTVFMM